MPLRAAIALFLVIVLPLLGAGLGGMDPAPFLRFPPEGLRRPYPAFSWPAFIAIWSIFLVILAAWLRGARLPEAPAPTTRGLDSKAQFPAWGWAGVALCLSFWAFAWLPDPGHPLRRYAFPPLWFGFVLTLNAVLEMRYGRSPLTRETRFFLLLFPAGALFWWVFEFLNRFVNNWVYVHAAEPGAVEYLLHASLSFSTVLPAVYTLRRCLDEFTGLRRRLRSGPRLRLPNRRAWPLFGLFVSSIGMAGVGLAPDFLFPFLWVGPLGIWFHIEWLARRDHPWSEIAEGDWSRPLAWALAALICGFLWEFWNAGAMPKWEYQIPWFDRFHLFEMPVSGYLGYLPFGLECAAAATVLRACCQHSARATHTRAESKHSR